MELPEGLEIEDYDVPRKIIVDFIKNYVNNAGAKGVILGLSGGIDSSLVVTLATEALGSDRVYGMLMPVEAEQDDVNIRDAKEVANWLGIQYEMFELREAVAAFGELNLDRMALGNVKARLRMVTLYALANKNNLLVIGTGNKSELLTGYFTKYGDGGCDLLPIADLYKMNVFALSRHLGLPKAVIEKAPSAGLWQDQTDEGELGILFSELDSILFHRYEKDLSWEEIISKGYPSEKVERVKQLISSSQHKRDPLPSPKIWN